MTTKSKCLAIATWLLCGCQSYPFIPTSDTVPQPITKAPDPGTPQTTEGGTTGGGTPDKPGITDKFEIDAVKSTDILFVIDSSGSMADKQARLATNSQQFIATLVSSGNPFRIGIVTTDVVNNNESGRLHDMGNGNRWLDAPDQDDPQAATKGQALIDSFVHAVTAVGTGGDGREAGLLSAMSALGVSNPQDGNVVAYNAGFLRTEADLAVVILSDEDDCSRNRTVGPITDWTNENCYDKNLETQRYTGAGVVQTLAQVKANDVRRVRAGAIVAGATGPEGTFTPTSCYTLGQSTASNCGCWSRSEANVFNFYCQINSANGQSCAASTSPACDATMNCVVPGDQNCIPLCGAMGGYRYDNFITELRAARTALSVSAGTARGSICDASFAQVLSNIASDVVAPNCFNLASLPDRTMPVTVTVERNVNSSQGTSQTIAELNPSRSGACTACGGACATGSWTIAGQEICLGCGMFLLPGDQLTVNYTPSR